MPAGQGEYPLFMASGIRTDVNYCTAVVRGIRDILVHIELVSRHSKDKVFLSEQVCYGSGEATGAS